MGFLQGKRALIVGVASKRSIAWGIAEAMHRQGAELAFTYQTEKLKSRVEQVAEACESNIIIPCDVAYDEQIENTFTELASTGITMTSSSTPSVLHRVNNWSAIIWMRSPAKASRLPTTSARTALSHWPRPAAR